MGFTLPHQAIEAGRDFLPAYDDPYIAYDGAMALISERFNPYLPPDWSLIQLKINFVQNVARRMRQNNMPATSGGSANIVGWVHICSVIGGGISWEAWQGLNEFEQEAILQQANEHNRELDKKAQQETQNLTQQMNDIQSKNQPSMFSALRAQGSPSPFANS